MEKIRLYCFPYAGGTSSIYASWQKEISSLIEICPVELPGRGKRFGKQLLNNINDVVEDVFNQIKDKIHECKFVFFGHSMGALIIYELVHKLIKNNCPEPEHIFVSGRFPPHIEETNKLSHLDNKDFVKSLYELGGLPNQIIECQELLDIYLPVLRADYNVVENYQFRKNNYKWNFDISVLYGENDCELETKHIHEWQAYTNKSCRVFRLPGGHFFINDSKKVIATILESVLINKNNFIESDLQIINFR